MPSRVHEKYAKMPVERVVEMSIVEILSEEQNMRWTPSVTTSGWMPPAAQVRYITHTRRQSIDLLLAAKGTGCRLDGHLQEDGHLLKV